MTVPENRPGLLVAVNCVWDWPLPRGLLQRGVRAALERSGIEAGEISLTFLDDREIRALNLEYLGKDRSTDVLAFALHDVGDPVLGDVYVGYEQASRQARELGIEIGEELLRLAVHGTLHVLGHRHPEGEDRMESEMFRLQEEILTSVLRGAPPPG